VPGIILRKYKGYWSKRIHSIVFTLAIGLLIAAIWVAYSHKTLKDKPHFRSYHGIGGLILLSLYIGQGLGGLLALDPDLSIAAMKNMKKLIKKFHKSGGKLVTIFGILVILSGWWKFFPYHPAGVAAAVTASLLVFLDTLVKTKTPQVDIVKQN
jgi:hypothetical protein